MSEGLVEELKKEISQIVEIIKDGWADGAYSTESIDGTAQLNAKWLGKCEMAMEILDLIDERVKEWENE